MALVISAAGDLDTLSCFTSPADSPFVLSVGAIAKKSYLPLPGSNYGDCIDVFAPGENITGPWIGESKEEWRAFSGSSAATAIATGLATQMLDELFSNEYLFYLFENHVRYEEASLFMKEAFRSVSTLTVTNNLDGMSNDYRERYACEISSDESMDKVLRSGLLHLHLTLSVLELLEGEANSESVSRRSLWNMASKYSLV